MDPADPADQPDPRAGGADGAEPLRHQDEPHRLTRRSGRPLPLFSFSQIEVPWALGPPDGRYLMRRFGDPPEAAPSHVLLFSTLGAAQRRAVLGRSRRQVTAEAEPDPTPVRTGRATIIDVARPHPDEAAASQWLREAGEPALHADLTVLNQALHAFRLVTANPYLHELRRDQLLVARIGYGPGDEVADGRWTAARELRVPSGRERRAKVLHPQARLAAVLGQRERGLACEELTLRARLDLDHGRHREAALQLWVALDATLAELAVDPQASRLGPRIEELREQRDAVADAAQAALSGDPPETARETIAFVLGRIEAALRARAVASA